MTQDGVHVTAPLERMVGSETQQGKDRMTDDASGTPAPTDSCSALQGTPYRLLDRGRKGATSALGRECAHRIWCRGIRLPVKTRDP